MRVVWWWGWSTCAASTAPAPSTSSTTGVDVDVTGFAVTTGVPLEWVDPATNVVWGVDAETGLIESVSPLEQTWVGPLHLEL